MENISPQGSQDEIRSIPRPLVGESRIIPRPVKSDEASVLPGQLPKNKPLGEAIVASEVLQNEDPSEDTTEAIALSKPLIDSKPERHRHRAHHRRRYHDRG